MSTPTQKPGWRAFPHGNILDAATSREFKTGAWATEVPVWHPEKCIHCLNCWIFCPDDCWEVKDQKILGVSLEYCKGCGICVRECLAKPDKAITMHAKDEA
ncbi:4Fe-4S binding protein [candidate division FCPU426 bacterium]|nr:4Fe-4S binding protein [candidate division FCPU426 bacterium]